MKEIIEITDHEEIQKYIENKEGVKLNRRTHSIEKKPKGHLPHYDTGDREHMMWCKYSASTLLTQDFEGGDFVFLNDKDEELQVIDKEAHFNKTLVYDVSHKHMVRPHTGNRRVELSFWEVVG